jgi:hypothetical protein
MLCEKCSQQVDSGTCDACGAVVIKLGSFCYVCGQKLEQKPVKTEPEADAEFDFSSRVLCSDGTCIGVINEQGVCKICGKAYSPES